MRFTDGVAASRSTRQGSPLPTRAVILPRIISSFIPHILNIPEAVQLGSLTSDKRRCSLPI